MRKKWLKKVIILLVSLYIIVGGALYFLQEKMLFMPQSLSPDYNYSFSGNFEEINLHAEDGATLNALHFKAEKPKGVILYFHGNAGELSSWGLVAQQFVNIQYDVLVMDYRSYGKSTGQLSESALYSDAQLFYNFLAERYSEENIVVYGRSLGTTFATYVSAKNNPKQLILEAPFYSIDEVASQRFPIFPVSLFLKYHFPTYKYIQQVESPILIFHGTEDFVINYKNSVKLSRLPTKGKLSFKTIDGANHNNLVNSEIYQRSLDSIL